MSIRLQKISIRLMPQFCFMWSKDDHTHQVILTNDPYISTLAAAFQYGADIVIIVKLRSTLRMMAL